MKLVHYSVNPDLTMTDPDKIDTSGVLNSNRRQGRSTVGRTYFYMHGTQPEHVVTSLAKHKYTAELTPEQKIYDIGTDEAGVIKRSHERTGGYWSADDYAKDIKASGYYGYTNSQSSLPNVVALLYPHPVVKETHQENINSIVDRLLNG